MRRKATEKPARNFSHSKSSLALKLQSLPEPLRQAVERLMRGFSKKSDLDYRNYLHECIEVVVRAANCAEPCCARRSLKEKLAEIGGVHFHEAPQANDDLPKLQLPSNRY